MGTVSATVLSPRVTVSVSATSKHSKYEPALIVSSSSFKIILSGVFCLPRCQIKLTIEVTGPDRSNIKYQISKLDLITNKRSLIDCLIAFARRNYAENNSSK